MMDSSISVLVVDDHQIIIDGVKSMLSQERRYAIIDEANDGEAAFMLISQAPERYQVILTDISMPIMSGTELCMKIKSTYPHIKVLVLSMYNSTSVVKEVINADADGYILKNAGRNEFLKALYKVSDNSTYFSQDIIPIIYQQYQAGTSKDKNLLVLSPREKEVLTLIAKELTSEEIAQQLFISKKTVDTHRAHLLEKSKSRSTVGLVKYAIKNGLIEL